MAAAAAIISGRDWASLPSPLLCLVAERLIPVAYARLRAVCTSWASAVSPEDWEEGMQQQQPYYLPRSLHCPWLMVASKDTDGPSGSLTFLSLPDSLLRPYRIPSPDLLLHEKRIVGSHAGWLATVDAECVMRLINPLTHAHILLPSISTHPAVGVVRDPSSGSPVEFLVYNLHNLLLPREDYPPVDFRDTYIKKMIFTSIPSFSSCSGGDYIVAFICGHSGWLAFARAGDKAWSLLENYGYVDVVFVDRKLYAVTDNGEIRSFDFSEPTSRLTVVAERTEEDRYAISRYLVVSSGDILQLTRHEHVKENITLAFTVEKIDLMTGKENNSRITIKDLGGRSIFVGIGQSCCVSARDIPGVRQNCIYFTDDDCDWFYCDGKQCERNMGVYDLKEETVEPLYPPGAWLNWPPPIWFSTTVS